MKSFKASPSIEFKCPKCGEHCIAGFGTNPVTGEKDAPVILHKMPQCQYFLDTDIVQIMKDVNAKLLG